jgi:DNA-directed RNA polymerase specialized sigma24 family protein
MTDTVRRFRGHKAGEPSAADLLRECGQKLTDRALWAKFQERFQGLIFLYLLRSLRFRSIQEDAAGVVPDLAQEVYMKLVQQDGQVLRSFRGDTEFSVMAFLAKIAANVVQDFHRRTTREKRRGLVIPIDAVKTGESGERWVREAPEFDTGALSSILSWIDIERVIEADPDRKNARRNALIFKLHYVDGFAPAEIARFPGFDLTPGGVETVLGRLRKRIQE